MVRLVVIGIFWGFLGVGKSGKGELLIESLGYLEARSWWVCQGYI